MTETRVCLSLAEPTVPATRALLQQLRPACAEIRLDAMRPTRAEVEELFRSPLTLVATCRPGTHDDGERAQLLLAAIAAGAAFVDIELEADQALRRELRRATRGHDCRLIVSVHAYENTPPRAQLSEWVERCHDAGGDLAKIACWVRSSRDAARLIGLLDDEPKPIVVGLGPQGTLVRIVAPLLGSPLAFASAGRGRETAPGQLDAATLDRWLEELGSV